ncbi:VCBS domain-containing protein [Pseudomonas sp. GM17]|uniref:VCBS domain-containing protein n=1 Tax=Pseudomonas sp. GM17 TaxID=1144323 RepID=UPI0024DFCE69|nr:VCBS domain-containing protein [Pseudomonas sp. GM17]WIE51997.1 VCBS domain-containing protein [Pseudomonas sp. GM17]
MATTTTTSGGTTTSFSNTPQAQDDIFTTGVIGTSSASITEDLLGVVYLDIMSNDLGGNAKTLWSLDNATSLSTATKVYAPADLLVQDTGRVEATSSDTSFNGAKIWITSDGKVGYDAATLSTAFKAQLQALAAGASLTDSFTYAIRLGNGTLSWATAQVQFAGANDSVTMSLGAQAGTATEDAATTPSPTDSHSATGTIAFNDVDLSDTHTASFVAAPGNATALGNFVLASVTEAANAANGTVNWTYTLNNAAAQSLAQGQTASETYVVTISDGHGSSTTQNVIITITGTNDQVQITSDVQAGDAKEDSGDYAASGNITFTDADLIDTHSVTVTPGASGYLGSFTTDPLNDSTSTGSGSLGWHFAVDNAALQFLGEGQTLTQTYNVAIGDGAVQTVTITITGTNDRPTLTIADTAGAMSEGNAAATLSDSSALSFADLDNIDAVTVSHTANGNIAWSGGTLNAGVASALVAGFSVDQNSWDYSSNQNLDFLGAGETITFSYTVVATDDSGAANATSATQTVSITITGSNDAPVLNFATGNDLGAVQEDTALSVSGQFSSADIDHAATATWSIVGTNTGTYGSIAVDSTGQWTYTLANGSDGVAGAVQSLKAGESHDEVFSVQVSDGLGGVDTQQVTVTVTGSNDAPVISFASGNDVGAVKEDTTLSVSGQFSSTDIDHNATATWSIAGSNTGSYGSIAVDGSGQWTYTLANGSDGVAGAVQSLKAGESHDEVFSVQVSDGLGGVDTQLVTITVTGSNDAPVLSFAPGNDVGAVQEDSTLSVSGQFSSADIDHAATATWSIAGSNTGSYGSIVVDGSGQWTYTLANGTDGVASAVQSLKAGESHDEVFSVQVSDGLGGVDTQQVTVTVTGSNDAPVLSFAPGNDVGAVQEDSTLSVSGQFSSTDIDHDAAATWSINGSPTGTYGSIAVDGSGQWTYTLASGTDGVASAVQSLKAGESHDEVFSVQVSDGLGGVDTQLVTVTVTGSNDAPVLNFALGNDVGTAQEDTTLSVSGQFSSTDIDHNATATWSIVGANTGAFGSIAVDSTGQWTYTLANGSDGVASAVQSLKAGESHDEVFSVQVSDGLGGMDTQQVTITVTGSNDQPTLTIADTAGAMNEGDGTATLSDSGALSFADVDNTDTVTVSHTANGDIAWSGGTLNPGVASALVAGFSVDQNSWDYSSSQNLDFLGAGETITFSYRVVATDDSGTANAASATQTVTITLTGTNDQPTLTIVDTTGAMNEGDGSATLSDSGALSFADLDSTDVVTVSHTANGDIAWSGGILNASVASALVAGFSVDQNSWDYSSSQNLDFLGAGETITFSYTVVATDDSGAANAASATQTVSITITGSNDAPVLSFASGNDAGAVKEDTTLSVSGQFSSTDIDHAATASWSIEGSNTGAYGSIAVDSSGQWTYTLANGTDGVASAVQSLKAGESHNEVFSVQVSDGLGGVDTQLVTVTVTGSNDAPVLSFATSNDAGAVKEDTTLSVSGQFSSTDIDHDATATWTINGSPTGSYGSIAVDSSGQWTYTLANGTDGVASAVQSLKAGESHNEVFSVQVSDGLGGVDTQLVTVTVTGSNDAPVLSFATGNDAGAVKEDTTLSVSGQFSSTDIDHDATATWTINGSPNGSYGSIVVDSTGQWTYTLANGTDGVVSAVQSLKAGESHDEVFSVQVSDGLGGVDTQQVTVTVTGSNDAPVLNFTLGNDVGTAQEDITLSVSGQFSSTDIDHDATATWSIVGTNTGSYGSIAVDNSGQWTYTLANGTDGVASAVQSLKAGESHDEVFSVQVSDGLGGVDTQLVTVTVTGTNDTAVLSSASVTLSETNAPLTTGGSLTVSDIDSPESFQAQIDTAGNYGQFSIGTGGAWTYAADSAHNEFTAGTTYTDTFAVSSADGTLTSVTVHILGTNDTAVLSAGIANLTETNAATDISTAGTLTISDVDSAATFVAQTNTVGSYGQFSIGTGGAWTYAADSAHNEFAAGTTYTDTFAVSSADGTLTSVTVHILGTNDTAVLSAGIANLTETNAAVDISTAGTLTISDVDSAATFVAQTNTVGSYGQFSIGTGGAWTYAADSAHNEFAAGTTYTDTFAVSSADGTLTSVTVHILGTNDTAVLSAGIANLTETNAATDISTAGTLTISDVDSAATFVAQTNTVGSYGQFSIGTGGAWTYAADSAHNEFAAGTTYTDTFAVSSADGTLTSVTVHILGTNDTAVLSAGIANLTETNAAVDISTAGTLTISDVDSAATFVAQTNTAGNYGQFSIGTGGAWTYVADSAHNEFAAGTTYTDTFAVSSADGTLTSVTVHIAGSNDLPTITSNGGGTTASINVAENTAAVTTVAATDVDLPAQTLSYSIVGGADAAKFSIVSGTGALSFISAPNFEAPADSGTNNVYDVIVRASDGTLFDDQAIAVTVTGVNDNSPVITSNGGGATASVSVAENTTAVTTVVATDADLPAQTLSYSILNTAGTDFGKFSISSSGVLTFNSAPDYENPQDIGGTDGDNAYVVDVQVADGNGGTDTQTITVNVQNVVETPVDSVAPTVTVTGTALGSSIGSTSTVTFQFSETVSGFNLSDVSVTTTSGAPRGTFSNFTQVDGDTYTATLTRTLGGSIKVDVAANSYTDLAGNPGAAGSSANLPAGVAGEPINLALDIPLAEINGPVTVAISGIPSGWVFNAGTDNGDGTWTVQTNDPGALTVTTPSDFAGALVLDVNMYWSNSDGSTASAYVFNNVEVYAPGSPIFALSADDNLTGSSGADTFVFAQPIGNNQIYNFDVMADKIDLIGFTGVTTFADLSISNDVNGNALVSIGSGQTVTLRGVDAADLSEANFQFDRDPLTSNTGTLTIADGAIMPFGGSLDNSGTIELGSAGNETRLEILFRGATLTGGGQVLLSDNAQNVIFGGSADTVLTNVDNRISGAGQLGAGQMILANAGLILASGLNSLVLDTGTHTITNSGVLESTGTGGMTVASTVENTGHLWANGGDLHLLADVTGNGSATIDGNASLTFAGAAHTSVAFHGEGAGSLVIAQAEAAGSLVGILGLESDDLLTFGDLAFGANTQLGYTANASGAGGLLTVDDGTHRAEVNLLGHYSVEDFQVTDGGEAGTQVSFHGESSGTLVGSMLADTLSGGDGNDIIVGRGGEDTLSGGAGADVFAYLNANEGGDHILDYNFAEGDTVDLSTLLNANFVSGTSQVADFVQLAQSGSDITVQVDPDGANNGKHFVDVAVLDHAGTPSPDLVRTWFGEADHTLTA